VLSQPSATSREAINEHPGEYKVRFQVTAVWTFLHTYTASPSRPLGYAFRKLSPAQKSGSSVCNAIHAKMIGQYFSRSLEITRRSVVGHIHRDLRRQDVPAPLQERQVSPAAMMSQTGSLSRATALRAGQHYLRKYPMPPGHSGPPDVRHDACQRNGGRVRTFTSGGQSQQCSRSVLGTFPIGAVRRPADWPQVVGLGWGLGTGALHFSTVYLDRARITSLLATAGLVCLRGGPGGCLQPAARDTQSIQAVRLNW
jgi:hypothetical protein